MEGLTVMKWQCLDCDEWFKKSERSKHEDKTDHKINLKGKIVTETPIIETLQEIQEKLIETKPPAKVFSRLFVPKPKAKEPKDFHFTGDPYQDYPATMKAINNLKLLMKHTGVIPLGGADETQTN